MVDWFSQINFVNPLSNEFLMLSIDFQMKYIGARHVIHILYNKYIEHQEEISLIMWVNYYLSLDVYYHLISENGTSMKKWWEKSLELNSGKHDIIIWSRKNEEFLCTHVQRRGLQSEMGTVLIISILL